MCIRALIPKFASILGHVEQAFWEMPLFTEWSGASSFEVILAWRQSKRSTTGTLASGTSGFRRISLILPRERTRRRIRLCHFSTLIDIVEETTIVSVGIPSSRRGSTVGPGIPESISTSKFHFVPRASTVSCQLQCSPGFF